MNTDGHYRVNRNEFIGGNGYIRNLSCAHCDYVLSVDRFKRTGDKSGAPKYCRTRAAMVKHLHESHRAALANASLIAAIT
ncbi:MAG: hypothetical protein WD051_14000 [Steroidobacteraceae bacterium]